MDERQLVCYLRSDTCSLRDSVCCVLLTFFPFNPFSPIIDLYLLLTTSTQNYTFCYEN